MSKHGKSDLLPDDEAPAPATPEASDDDEVTLVATPKETSDVTQVATPKATSDVTQVATPKATSDVTQVATPSGKAAPSKKKIDPDKTGELDGLPPFALGNAETLRADPDKTNRFVSRKTGKSPPPRHVERPVPGQLPFDLSDDDEADDDRDTLDGADKPAARFVAAEVQAQSSTAPPSPQPPRPAATPITGDHDAADLQIPKKPPLPSSDSGFSGATLAAVAALTLIIGLLLGGFLVLAFGGVDPPPRPRRHVSDAPTIAAHPAQAVTPATPAPATPAAPGVTPPAPDAAPGAPAADAAAPPATPPGPDEPPALPDATMTRLPDVLIIPMQFAPGQHRPEEVDNAALERIAEIISASQSIRVEIVGYSVNADSVTPERAHRLGERRANAAMDSIRAYGPSRRRFTARAAHVDEERPQGLTESSDPLFRPVLLRVTVR